MALAIELSSQRSLTITVNYECMKIYCTSFTLHLRFSYGPVYNATSSTMRSQFHIENRHFEVAKEQSIFKLCLRNSCKDLVMFMSTKEVVDGWRLEVISFHVAHMT